MAHASPDVRFDRLAEAIFRSLLELRPIDATLLGLSGEWNRRFPRRSEEAARDEAEILHALLRELGAHRDRDLSIERAVDARLARGGLNARILRLQRIQPWKRCPTCYVRDIVTGVHALLPPSPLPEAERHDALLARLGSVPAHLDAARLQLENPAANCTEEAEFCARGAVAFWKRELLPELKQVADPSLRADLLVAMNRASASMEEHANWLQGILLSRSNGSFAAGRALLERLLAEEQAVVVDPDHLIALGQKTYQTTLREMKRLAASIGRRRPWSRVIEALKASHPEASGLLDLYRVEIERARTFLEHDPIVPLPAGGGLRVEETPAFERPLAGRTTYSPPSLFGPEACGALWITHSEWNDNGDHGEALLRGHPIDGIAAHVVQNVWPGHHLRALVQRESNPRPLRWLFPASSFEQGWALYASELMAQRGYFQEERAALFRLHDLLVHACLVMVDVELHTGRLGWTEAIEFLVHKAHLERPAASAEVRRACARPTLASSDILGKIQICELVDELREREGSRFDLRRCHEELLSHGPIPVELIRMEMGLAGRGTNRRAFPVPVAARATS